MKDEYDSGFDSPEAHANYLTRHIRNLHERRRKRDELIEQFRKEKVVDMFPGKKKNKPL